MWSPCPRVLVSPRGPSAPVSSSRWAPHHSAALASAGPRRLTAACHPSLHHPSRRASGRARTRPQRGPFHAPSAAAAIQARAYWRQCTLRLPTHQGSHFELQLKPPAEPTPAGTPVALLRHRKRVQRTRVAMLCAGVLLLFLAPVPPRAPRAPPPPASQLDSLSHPRVLHARLSAPRTPCLLSPCLALLWRAWPKVPQKRESPSCPRVSPCVVHVWSRVSSCPQARGGAQMAARHLVLLHRRFRPRPRRHLRAPSALSPQRLAPSTQHPAPSAQHPAPLAPSAQRRLAAHVVHRPLLAARRHSPSSSAGGRRPCAPRTNARTRGGSASASPKHSTTHLTPQHNTLGAARAYCVTWLLCGR